MICNREHMADHSYVNILNMDNNDIIENYEENENLNEYNTEDNKLLIDLINLIKSYTFMD